MKINLKTETHLTSIKENVFGKIRQDSRHVVCEFMTYSAKINPCQNKDESTNHISACEAALEVNRQGSTPKIPDAVDIAYI